MLNFPAQMSVGDLNQKHCWHKQHERLWFDLDLLYRGGCYIQEQAARFLIKRPKELSDVYNQRLARFSYQNVLGTALGWYKGAMFERAPEIIVRAGGKEVKGRGDFYSKFLSDCTRSGKSFNDMFARALLDLVLFRSAFVLTDLPAPGEYDSREAQRKAGALDPYLVRFAPWEVLNWSADDLGNLDWVVVKTEAERREFGKKPATVLRWYVFDRETAAVYETVREGSEEPKVANLIGQTVRHPLASVGRVPVRMLTIDDDFWMAHRVYLPVLDHLNQDNGFGWALLMANLPIPVIKGRFQGGATASETSYIQLEPGGEFGYAEPSGSSYEHAAKRCESLREEIHRAMYLQAQARSQSATPAAQSGYSKEQDMAPSQRVLSGLGDVLKKGMRSVLEDVAAARGESDTTFDVVGFDFEEDDSRDMVATAQSADNLGIHSDTFRRELHKKTARQVLKGLRDETLSQIDAEIDAGPTIEEIQQAEAATTAGRIAGRLAAAAGGGK